MAYTLQAVVGDASVLQMNPLALPVVALPQGKVLLPLSDSVREQNGDVPFLPLVDGGCETVPEALAELCIALSTRGRIVYLEAEFFGGDGSQAFLLAEGGKIVVGPVVNVSAINTALRLLGVSAAGESDEFEALQLGRHRSTEAWLDLKPRL